MDGDVENPTKIYAELITCDTLLSSVSVLRHGKKYWDNMSITKCPINGCGPRRSGGKVVKNHCEKLADAVGHDESVVPDDDTE